MIQLGYIWLQVTEFLSNGGLSLVDLGLSAVTRSLEVRSPGAGFGAQ